MSDFMAVLLGGMNHSSSNRTAGKGKQWGRLALMQNKEPGMFPVRVAWSAVDKKRPALSWTPAKTDKQTHHSADRLSLLPHPHTASQQTGCLS